MNTLREKYVPPTDAQRVEKNLREYDGPGFGAYTVLHGNIECRLSARGGALIGDPHDPRAVVIPPGTLSRLVEFYLQHPECRFDRPAHSA